ncbi:hypothetical protein F3Y22_tig00000002pilonHSYRG00264 [Hibiscus syriacus]|uniref:Uncharacterized protein n=1 Tax=Hibiscus syriacus TaxID=106335 RepID=A0A6A3D6Z3_HIBSY|nr:hypothetical protein F3Y22_tig00000002pilonHSYRG00264 [Hibiscus syriacus]
MGCWMREGSSAGDAALEERRLTTLQQPLICSGLKLGRSSFGPDSRVYLAAELSGPQDVIGLDYPCNEIGFEPAAFSTMEDSDLSRRHRAPHRVRTNSGRAAESCSSSAPYPSRL